MEVQHSETKVQGDTKKRRGLLGTPTSILIRLLFLFLEMFELFKTLYEKHFGILNIIKRLEEVGGIKIEGRARRKIKSCFHYLIEENEAQVNHFWRQFEKEIRKQVNI